MLRVSDADAIRSPELYLYTVANNLVKEHAVLDRRQSSGVDVNDTTVQQQLAELPAFDADLDATQRMTRLRAVLAQLRPTHRAAVVLHYRDGLSYPEIAGRLGVSSHMVKKYLAQSLLHCRRRMARLR
jgi:RNA polymerase sigma-70 factor (ECF subfamily)